MAIHCAQIWREIMICHNTMSSSLIEERRVRLQRNLAAT